MKSKKINIWQLRFILPALKESLTKLNPLVMINSPVMFIVEMVTIVTSCIVLADIFTDRSIAFDLQITLWLWFTVIFANFA
jgi:K+-transporting ATPase ATPase B chain